MGEINIHKSTATNGMADPRMLKSLGRVGTFVSLKIRTQLNILDSRYKVYQCQLSTLLLTKHIAFCEILKPCRRGYIHSNRSKEVAGFESTSLTEES